MKLLFYTDSIIIGIYLETEQVTFYAIPTMILQYLEQFVWAFIAVLLPIISGLEALGNKKANSSIYQLGTKYALLGCSPIFLVLFVAGDDFIGLWMGAEYKEQSGEVMHILLIGYIFFLAQLTAHGILKGLSKHKILAVLLSAEALFNLGLSQYLAPIYGINGVAMGTVIPLIVINVFLLPLFTCRQLKINYFSYVARSYLVPLGSLFLFLVLLTIIDFRVDTFLDLIILSLLTLVIFYAYCFFIHLDQELKIKIINIYLKIRFADRAKNEK